MVRHVLLAARGRWCQLCGAAPGPLRAGGRHQAGVVYVVILHVADLHLVDGEDGEWVLEPAVRRAAVKKGLHHD